MMPTQAAEASAQRSGLQRSGESVRPMWRPTLDRARRQAEDALERARERGLGAIGRASGRELRYVPISVDSYLTGAADHGVPDDVVGFLGYLFTDVLDGRNAHLADGVQRALGREPRDFADYARDAAATGVWNPS